MKNASITFFLFLFFCISANSQEKHTVINLQLDEYLEQGQGDEIIHLLIEVKNSQFEEDALNYGAKIKVKQDRFYSISLPISNVRRLAKSNDIKR